MFPGCGWVGKSHLVCDAHLLVLHIHTSSFGAHQLGEMVQLFSEQRRSKEAFHGLGVQDIAEFDSD
jgi:hypothetical protein